MPSEVLTPPELARAPQSAPLFDRLAARVSERSNPVLVKEVRQSLRSTYFRVVFLIALVLTTCVGAGILMFAVVIRENTGSQMLGLSFFSATLGATGLGAMGLVPFAAFASMNAEADEHALELLQLSNLRPITIVMGKLLAAAIVALLVVALDVPFACLAWSMGGVDPWHVLLSLASTLSMSVCLSAVAIAVSSMTHTRWVRIVLMVIFGFFVLTIAQNAAGLLFFSVLGMRMGGAPASVLAIGLCTLAIVLDVTATAVAVACGRLAHREESRSTPLRYVACATGLAGAVVAMAWKIVRPSDDEALIVLGVALALTALPLFLCCTEEERLPLGPRARPPRRGWLSPLRTLLVGGGGRGAALASVILLAMPAIFALGCLVEHHIAFDDLAQGFVLSLYTWIYLLLPSGVLSFLGRFRGGALVIRALSALFPLGSFLVVSFAQFFALSARSEFGQHIANPFHVLQAVANGGSEPWPSLIGLALIVVVTLLANGVRIARGFGEVAQAQRERDARRAQVAGAPSA